MKHSLTFLIILVLFSFVGCATKAVPYEMVQDGVNSASINFKRGNPDVYFVSLNGLSPPNPKAGTHWAPVIVPAETALRITVHTTYEHQQKAYVKGGLLGAISEATTAVSTITRGVDREVIFTCPALVDGGKYMLSFEKGSGIPGSNNLILTDISTKKIFYQQTF